MLTANATLLAWLPPAAFWSALLTLFFWEAIRPGRSHLTDSRNRFAANFGLGGINFLAFALLPLSSVAAAVWAATNQVGLLNQVALPQWFAFAATFALRSLAAYVLHVVAHKVPLLWRMHRVHHADTLVDLSTGFRHHPMELLLVAGSYFALTVCLGLSPKALIVYEGMGVLVSLWTHANIRVPDRAERALEMVLVTPATHYVHHSARQFETDSNYGELFSVWDRLFGTFQRLEADELHALRAGLGVGHDVVAASFVRQLLLPFRESPEVPVPNDR